MTIAPDHLAAWIGFKEVVSELHKVIQRAPTEGVERRQVSLLAALNRLELVALGLPTIEPESDGYAKSPNTYNDRYQSLRTAFPELGYYNKADMRLADAKGDIVLGDAADDLADILRDLDDVLWRETNVGLVEAIVQARESYEIHFGAHLADLRAYVYRQRFFGP